MGYIHYYDKELVNVALTEQNLLNVRKKESRFWIDLEDPTNKELDLLKRKLKIHPTTIEDLKAHNSRTKIEEFKKYLVIVMYNVIEKNGDLKQIETDLIIGRNFVITTHSHIIENIKAEKKNQKKLTRLFRGGSDIFLHYIMDNIINHYMPIVEEIDEEIDVLEDQVSDHADKKILERIIKIKRKVIFIKRTMYPLKEKTDILARKEGYKFISKEALPYFRDLHDNAVRLAERIDTCREGSNSLFETYMSSISYSMNEVMKILSIISTIMLPLTFITGIFGMNFQFMPWVKDIYGFWFSIILMLIIAIFMLLFFKKKKWI